MGDYGYYVHTQESKKDGAVFYLALDRVPDIEFRELVISCARDIYGDAIPENVQDRIETELKYVFSSDSASYFMALNRIFRTAGISDWDVAGQGSCGASFIAYLLGINGGVNPLEDNGYSLDARFFYGENGDKPRFGMSYDIIPEKIEDLREAIAGEKLVKEYTECGIEEIGSVSEGFTVFKAPDEGRNGSFVKNSSCDFVITSGDITKVAFRYMPAKISEVLSSIEKQMVFPDYKGDFSGFDCGELNPGMKADDIIVMMKDTGVDMQIPNGISSHYIVCGFNDLIRLIALCKGTDVWTDNVQDMISDGKITFDEIPCTRDGVYRLLFESGMSNAEAFRTTERIRKGKGLLPEQRKELDKLQISEWLIEYFDEVKYLPSEADFIAIAKQVWAVVRFTNRSNLHIDAAGD